MPGKARDRVIATGTALAGLLFLLSQPASASRAANHSLSLDRPFTLRNGEPSTLEREYHRMTLGTGPMSYILPRPCVSQLDSSRVCGEEHGWSHIDPSDSRRISLSPLAGIEYRRVNENVGALELGTLASGFAGPASFRVDARMVTEMHEDSAHASYDREPLDRQDKGASGTLAYSSYSRYRSDLSWDLPFGRVTVARDAVHWGPGTFANLAFGQRSLPFDQLSWITHLGPVSVVTLYGRLSIDGDSTGDYSRSSDTRSIYAHRYEWRALPDLVLGVSEQLVYFNREDAFAFIPVVPLFIAKGNGVEADNNGNISADICWRWAGALRLYSEFFIDDLQSPTSLFDDFWGNKWAWMLGGHVARDSRWGQAGAVLEYSRVEPWVYTHYLEGTAQIAHGGHPLGNPQGPDSQWIILKSYLRTTLSWYFSAQGELLWKGRDPGSNLQDHREDAQPLKKEFIRGIGSPRFSLSPQIGYAWKSIYMESSASFGRDAGAVARILWRL